MVRPGQEFLISNRFIRMLAFESARIGPDAPILSLIEEPAYAVTDRYAPMARFLAQDDVLLLVQHGLQAQSIQLRRERRSCYFEYVTLLTQEVRVARRLRTLAMASTERWSFRTLLVATVVSESSLLYLR